MKARRVFVLQHATPEGPGLIARAMEARELPMQIVRSFEGQPVPGEIGDALGLVVMGGPMGVSDAERLPYLRQEMKLIEQAFKANCPVLGVCLGSQMVAHVLGARVTRGPRKEIGWHRVTLSEDGLADPIFKGSESSFTAFHWHGDIFSLPPGATSLARSEQTVHQAFRYGTSVYGILFHLEVTQEIVEGMALAFAAELTEVGETTSSLLSQSAEHLSSLAERGGRAFAVWADVLAGRRDEIG